MHAETAEEVVIAVPGDHQQGEADGERKEAAQDVVQPGESVGDFERDDQQREGETEDDVREGAEPRGCEAAKLETVLIEVVIGMGGVSLMGCCEGSSGGRSFVGIRSAGAR